MSIPTITFGTTITTEDVWNALWQISLEFNTLTWEHLDLGTEKSFLYTSKNLKPSKIRFFAPIGGHDHGPLIGGKRIHPAGLEKRHFDVNSCSMLWQDFWASGPEEERYVILPGRVTISSANNSEQVYFVKPVTTYPFTSISESFTLHSSTATYVSSLDVQPYLDSSWSAFSYSVIAIIAQPTQGDTSSDNNTGSRASVIVVKDSTYGWLLAVQGSSSNGSIDCHPYIDYLVVLKVVGVVNA